MSSQENPPVPAPWGEIWLCFGDDAPECVEDWERGCPEITWCRDRVVRYSTRYVRADEEGGDAGLRQRAEDDRLLLRAQHKPLGRFRVEFTGDGAGEHWVVITDLDADDFGVARSAWALGCGDVPEIGKCSDPQGCRAALRKAVGGSR